MANLRAVLVCFDCGRELASSPVPPPDNMTLDLWLSDDGHICEKKDPPPRKIEVTR